MKAWWKSKTLWFNVATLGVMAGSGALGVTIPAKIAVPLVTGGNMVLRLLTNQAIGATDQPNDSRYLGV